MSSLCDIWLTLSGAQSNQTKIQLKLCCFLKYTSWYALNCHFLWNLYSSTQYVDSRDCSYMFCLDALCPKPPKIQNSWAIEQWPTSKRSRILEVSSVIYILTWFIHGLLRQFDLKRLIERVEFFLIIVWIILHNKSYYRDTRRGNNVQSIQSIFFYFFPSKPGKTHL